MSTLTLTNVNKHYSSNHALKDFTFEFHDGMYGLLGPNGAGKSTMMNIITQNIPADAGSEILWNGEDINKLNANYRSVIGFMPQQQELYPSFSAARFLGYIAALKGIPSDKIKQEVMRVLNLVELSDKASHKLGGFSGGMKQRVITRNLISSLAKDKIVIISTHIVSDIETIADEILLVKSGVLIDHGSVSELTSKVVESDKSLENLYMQYYGEE